MQVLAKYRLKSEDKKDPLLKGKGTLGKGCYKQSIGGNWQLLHLSDITCFKILTFPAILLNLLSSSRFFCVCVWSNQASFFLLLHNITLYECSPIYVDDAGMLFPIFFI